jgi:hypothetical protein
MKKVALVVACAVAALSVSARANADEVLDWDRTMLRAALIAATSPPNLTRVAALVQSAMFDAVNGIDKRYTHIHVAPTGPDNASRRAAVVQAAYVMLSNLYGSRLVVPPAAPTAQQLSFQATFDARRTVSLFDIAADESQASINSGIAWGESVASQIWTWRAADGFNAGPFPAFPDNLAIGGWRRTPNLPVSMALSAAGAGYLQISHQMPWTMSGPSQFRPAGPPALTSATYTRDFNETKLMGRVDSAVRTPDQTTAALFWNGATGSYLWNSVAMSLIERKNRDDDDDDHGGWHHRRRTTLLENARLFGILGLAMADAAIACWDAKFASPFWRPITAIRDPNDDGNPLTQADPAWMPLFPTPGHPEWPSGHSCLSGAAGAVLAEEFGDRTKITVESDVMLGVTRTFRSFSAALEDVKDARIFAGIHFRTATEDGQALGRRVAAHVLETRFQRQH